jgi:hypothetical protein
MEAIDNILQDTSRDSMIAVQTFNNLFHILNPGTLLSRGSSAVGGRAEAGHMPTASVSL